MVRRNLFPELDFGRDKNGRPLTERCFPIFFAWSAVRAPPALRSSNRLTRFSSAASFLASAPFVVGFVAPLLHASASSSQPCGSCFSWLLSMVGGVLICVASAYRWRASLLVPIARVLLYHPRVRKAAIAIAMLPCKASSFLRLVSYRPLANLCSASPQSL